MPSQTKPPALSVKNLSVAYNGKTVLEDITLGIANGALCAVIGPNGAGKSTLLKGVLDLVKPQGGEVDFWDAPLKKSRGRIAYMPQRAGVDWDFPVTALDVAAMGLYRQIGWGRRVTKAHKKIAADALTQVGLEEFTDRQIGQLSGGQQQRVFLARALAQNADLYIMDEPFAGIDARSEEAILGILRRLHAEGKTIICVHHNLQSVADYFDEAVLINRTLFAHGPAKDVIKDKALERAYGGRLMLS